jgi:hypothetical protein
MSLFFCCIRGSGPGFRVVFFSMQYVDHLLVHLFREKHLTNAHKLWWFQIGRDSEVS